MKRNITKFLAALALLVFMMPSMVGWGQTTWEKATSIQVGDVVVLVTENSNNSTTKMELTGFSNTSTVYGIGTAYTSTPAGTYTFEVVAGNSDGTFAFKHENSYLYWTSGNSLNVNSTLSNYTSWNVSIDGTNSKATITNAANNVRQIWWNVSSPRFACYTDKTEGNSYYITTLYKQVSSGGNTPSITASDVNIAYNANGGSISYNISNGVNNGVLTAATTSDWLTLGDDFTSPIGFTCSANPNYLARTATVTLTYKNGDETLATKNVTVTQASNPTGVGSQTNPLTVAQARTLIDGLNGGTSGEVYVTGIVSEIVTEYSTQYNNITFNMVDNSGDTDFLQAFRCTGTDAADVIVNDVAIVKGQLKLYSGTYEFNTGCQLVSLTHPSTPYITADDVEIAWDATSGSINYTVNNPVNGGELTATTTAAWLTIGTVGETVPFTCTANSETTTRTATVTLTYTYNRTTVTKDVTVTQAAYEAPHYTWDLSIASYNEVTNPDLVTWSSNYATMTNATGTSGTSASNYLGGDSNNRTSTRFYTNNVWTLTPVTGYTITSVVLTATTESYANAFNGSTWTNATASASGTTVTVTPTTGANAIQAVVGGTCGFTAVTVYYVVNNNPVISAEPVSIAFDATSGAIIYAITNGVAGGVVTAVSSEEWLTIGTIGETVPFTCTANNEMADRNAIVTLTYTYNRSTVTTDVTVTQAGNPNGHGSQADPYTVAEALAFDEYPVNGICVHGIVSTAPTQGPTNSGELTYYISDDGEATNELEVYKGKDLEQAAFTAQNDIKVGDIVTVYGNVVVFTPNNGDPVIEFASGNYLVAFERPQSTEPSITVTPETLDLESGVSGGSLNVTYENLSDEPSIDVIFVDAEGQELETPYDWVNYVMDETSIEIQVQANEGAARTAYLAVTGYDPNDILVQSNTVTINQAAYVAPFEPVTYTLATSIVSGKHYIITNGTDKAMGAQGSNNRPAVSVGIEDGVATVSSADVYEFVINGPDANGYYTIYDARNPGYLYAAGSGSGKNYLRTKSPNDANGQWSIAIQEGVATIEAQGSNTNNKMRFNSSNNLFSCYASGQGAIYLYVKENDTNYEFYKDIEGFGEAENGNYYLIASPVADFNPENTAVVSNEFDLYAFNQSESQEWRNYKQNSFSLARGTGYLYANNTNVTLKFTGTPNTNGQVTLAYDENASLIGYNLIGNPFGFAAYIAKDYYKMNEDGDELIEGSGAINPMEGVFVIAEGEGETVTFSTTPSNKGSQVTLNLSKATRSASTIDRAVVRFGEGQQLPKFQLFENSTKLYIPQGNQDFAIVCSANEGEMPVSFKASENGTYTLAVETENMEMDYLHLIDNMTGMDVDLLQTPNYTFEASTRDHANRFRLVFKGNNANEQTTETFAYFNGTSWTVSNLGEATLQVVDVMGRLVSSEQINGNATINLNETPGIYMLRLVNGNDVKVQKIVVR